MKQVDTRMYMSMMRELVMEGKEVRVPIVGSSMAPFLGERRDAVSLRKPQMPLCKGDIVCYERENGQFVVHRIWRIKKGKYYLVGDAQTEIEGPLDEKQIFAIVTKVYRKGKWISAGDFWWEFFRCVWIRMVSMRPVVLKAYGLVNKRKREL